MLLICDAQVAEVTERDPPSLAAIVEVSDVGWLTCWVSGVKPRVIGRV